ncbi:hypothetical protein N7493_009879 [Penicillium malachiteum]|uniref:Rhodopsin domain-containing protein n=1 Tax=Penicillium malachiteum TaxID=1324776 RepID=A0AAD6HDY8_9EURO|nr:hypothetical protein N7493_009879 [Penicillium malachiteum]
MGDRFHGDSLGPTVNMVSWFLMVVNILAVCARIGAKFRLFHKMKADDFIILASMLFSIIECICISIAIGSGYGNHLHNITDTELYLYSGYIVFIASLCLSKLSLITFVRNLTLIPEHRRFAMVVGIATILWTLVALIGAVFGAAFQCGISRIRVLWNLKCYKFVSIESMIFNIRVGNTLIQEAWRYFICISNIVTDALIVAQGFMIAFQIQASLKKRLLVAAVFSSRILVTGGIIAELILVVHAVNSADPPYNFCLVTILQGLVQCLSIVTACQDQLKPFITWMEPRRYQVHDDTATGTHQHELSNSESSLIPRQQTLT